MDIKYFVWKSSGNAKKSGLMKIPKVKPATIESIIQEVYAKNKTFGIAQFQSNISRENPEFFLVMESFIAALAEYMAANDPTKEDELNAIAKIAYHLAYKSISKQMEIEEMLK
jgi:hypothetical protein|tara:strand:+ start:168 stop:506 length:339 start_codon:yes stop_codon:yes gene_type:complete